MTDNRLLAPRSRAWGDLPEDRLEAQEPYRGAILPFHIDERGRQTWALPEIVRQPIQAFNRLLRFRPSDDLEGNARSVAGDGVSVASVPMTGGFVRASVGGAGLGSGGGRPGGGKSIRYKELAPEIADMMRAGHSLDEIARTIESAIGHRPSHAALIEIGRIEGASSRFRTTRFDPHRTSVADQARKSMSEVAEMARARAAAETELAERMAAETAVAREEARAARAEKEAQRVPRSVRIWSEADDRAILEGMTAGTRAQIIADKLGVTRNMVIGRWSRIRKRDE